MNEENGMTNEELNAWSILIAVIKNKDVEYENIDNIVGDICDIKELIQNLN